MYYFQCLNYQNVEAYAIALDFYIKNNFYTRESDKEILKKIDMIKNKTQQGVLTYI